MRRLRQKCSICSQNWADCIHMTYDDVYGAARRKFIIGLMIALCAVLIIGGAVSGMMA